jgi:hypothetical protein
MLLEVASAHLMPIPYTPYRLRGEVASAHLDLPEAQLDLTLTLTSTSPRPSSSSTKAGSGSRPPRVLGPPPRSSRCTRWVPPP